MPLSEPFEPGGAVELRVRRWQAGAIHRTTDWVSQEWPVALVFNGIAHAVMMCTPCDLEAFAAGFARSEGIIASNSEIQDIDIVLHSDGPAPHAEARLTILQSAFAALKMKRRTLAGRSGCGVCGVESIALLELAPEPVPDTGFLNRITPDALSRAVQMLPAQQQLGQLTGGLHAAAWCDAAGNIVQVCEDIGRHNALDKLIGTRLLARADLTDGFVFLSSRASYELIRKAARVGIPMVATISAPSSLAISIARQAGLRLVSFCRATGYVDYTTG